MAYDTSKIVKLGQLETALKECEAGLSEKLSLSGGTITGPMSIDGQLFLGSTLIFMDSMKSGIAKINIDSSGNLLVYTEGTIGLMGDVDISALTVSNMEITPAQIQRGSSQVADAGYGTYRTFTFPEVFTNVPTVIAILRSNSAALTAFNSFYNKTTGYTDIIPYNVTTSGFSIRWEFASDTEVEDTFYIDWVAIAT